MKSYEARLMLLQMTQRRFGVPTSSEPGQFAPPAEEIEAYVLEQKARLREQEPAAA